MSKGDVARKERILYAVLGVFLLGTCIYVYEELFSGGSPTPATVQTTVGSEAPAGAETHDRAVVVGGPAAKKIGTTSARLDPTLHMGAMLVSEAVVYSGTGRNIFSPTSVPLVPIPKPIAPARPLQTVYVPPPPTGPPPPPPIDLKFFGVETQRNGQCDQMQCKAFLLHDDSVFLAVAGDVVLRRYKVLAVDAKSIQVQDMQNNNRQTLPLLVN
ncbi:MAG TPA: hypothetical protein VGU23_01720 [Acidobacteriaceae bacterium]|nr:hypothetical protein [Acidobacteriaceae bacterium]